MATATGDDTILLNGLVYLFSNRSDSPVYRLLDKQGNLTLTNRKFLLAVGKWRYTNIDGINLLAIQHFLIISIEPSTVLVALADHLLLRMSQMATSSVSSKLHRLRK